MKTKSHYENCRDCKDSVKNFLASIFGTTVVNSDIDLPSRLEKYTNTSVYKELEKIYNKICEYRGIKNFVKAKKLPRVDFFVPKKKIIIEYDESQHFTKPREIALSHYPKSKNYGYSTRRWCELCSELNRKDNDPPYRDEQRAWYDTLRDFAPFIWGEGTTIRLYSRDLVWCSLDTAIEPDLRLFEETLLKNNEAQL